MKYKKIIGLVLILILIFSVTISASEDGDSFDEVKNFITEVYNNYQDQNFEIVYDFMHPDVKNALEKEKYINFQVKNTKKYNISISEVEVLKVTEKNEWPEEYKELINEKNEHILYEISITYKTIYQSDEKEKIIEKNSYVVLYKDDYYLLWDPEIIK